MSNIAPTIEDSPTRRASVELGLKLAYSVRVGGGTPTEADSDLNDASRAVVAAMLFEHGGAWVGLINRRDGERTEPVLTPVRAELVHNFGADFVVPVEDSELVRLILARDAAPYTGVRDDVARITAITARIREIGGEVLVWS